MVVNCSIVLVRFVCANRRTQEYYSCVQVTPQTETIWNFGLIVSCRWPLSSFRTQNWRCNWNQFETQIRRFHKKNAFLSPRNKTKMRWIRNEKVSRKKWIFISWNSSEYVWSCQDEGFTEKLHFWAQELRWKWVGLHMRRFYGKKLDFLSHEIRQNEWSYQEEGFTEKIAFLSPRNKLKVRWVRNDKVSRKKVGFFIPWNSLEYVELPRRWFHT